MKNLVKISLFAALVAMATSVWANPIREVRGGKRVAIDKHEIVDLIFSSSQQSAAPFEEAFDALFISPDGREQLVPAFYSGGNNWTVRFSASQSGEWSYTTQSALKGLGGKKGVVEVSSTPHQGNKGAVRVSEANPQKFVRESGDDFFMMGFECDFLFALNYHNEESTPQLDEMLDKVAEERFNYMIMNVYGYDIKWEQDERLSEVPQYLFGADETIFPFLGSNSDPDYSSLNIDFFDRLDRLMLKLNERDIVSHLMIYVWSKKVAWPELESTEGNRYFDYVVKRYQAFPNVVWDISKEALGYNRVDLDFINRRIDRLRSIDSFDRLVSVHDYRYCSERPESVDFIIKQDWGLQFYPQMLHLHRTYTDKPSFNIEHGGYEQAEYAIYDNGNYYDAQTCLRRNYEAVFAGAYPTHYWQGTSWNVIIYDWWKLDEQTHYRPKMEYYRYMAEFFDRYPYSSLKPNPPFNSSGYCMSDGEGLYLIYQPKESRKVEVHQIKKLSQGGVKYQWYNVTTGEYSPLVELSSIGDFSMPAAPWYQQSDAIFIMHTTPQAQSLPRLVITTDINIDSGDPDDRQSMAHLFHYSDELDIRAIIIDRAGAQGVEATMMALDAYRKDYFNESYNFRQMGFTHPDTLESRIYTSQQAAQMGLIGKIADEDSSPLYVAVWGHMAAVRGALEKRPEIADKLRVLTIGTEYKSPYDTADCGVRNWNDNDGHREAIFNDSRFTSLWWIENNWGYNGMFDGERPAEFMGELQAYGALGCHITEAVAKVAWSQYFRVGDTPTIMYFIDNANLDDPLHYNLGGYFAKPYPEQHPNYYIDAAPDSSWNYANPCQEWGRAKEEVDARGAQMTLRRDKMYESYIRKLDRVYQK
ncbi:MAG: nucleoside hydrolase-like domain-containing protein [Rikenellaceae bacterium]